MMSKKSARGLAAMACGAAMLLAGCDSDSSSASPTRSPLPSAASSSVSAGAPAPNATAAPAPAPAPAPADSPAPGVPAPAPGVPAPAPGDPAPAPGAPAPEKPAATPAPPAADAIWDPCTLPESNISAAGLDPATKKRLNYPDYPSWRMCQWQATDRSFELVIGATAKTTDDLLAPGTYKDLRRTEYYGRQVVQYRSVQDTHLRTCNVATPAPYGSTEFAVRTTKVQTDDFDSCADANKLGAALFRSLP